MVSEMAEITVFDLCSLYIEHDEEVVIWNVQEEKEAFRGTFAEAMYSSEFADYIVGSFGIENGIICINID
jgi:hypothetical protein